MNSNMSFTLGNFKGSGAANGVPVFIDKLPVTLGGVIGTLDPLYPAKFGRLVSAMPAAPNVFLMGTPAGSYPVGVLINDPAIAQNDPGMNDMYYEGRPATVIAFGPFQNIDVEPGLSEAGLGMEVWVNKLSGQIGFNPIGNVPSASYLKIDAALLGKAGPNGNTIWLNFPAIAATASEAKPVVATPTISPAAGAVASGTLAYLYDATEDAIIYYTVDGSTPDNTDLVYTGTPIGITGAVTIKAIAYKTGYTASAVLTAAYTVA